jgi:hypothetical protein
MRVALLIGQTAEGEFLIQSGESAEPFFALATKAVNTGLVGKDRITEGVVVRISGAEATLLKHFRCPTVPQKAKK